MIPYRSMFGLPSHGCIFRFKMISLDLQNTCALQYILTCSIPPYLIWVFSGTLYIESYIYAPSSYCCNYNYLYLVCVSIVKCLVWPCLLCICCPVSSNQPPLFHRASSSLHCLNMCVLVESDIVWYFWLLLFFNLLLSCIFWEDQ